MENITIFRNSFKKNFSDSKNSTSKKVNFLTKLNSQSRFNTKNAKALMNF